MGFLCHPATGSPHATADNRESQILGENNVQILTDLNALLVICRRCKTHINQLLGESQISTCATSVIPEIVISSDKETSRLDKTLEQVKI